RFLKMLDNFIDNSQFIIVTHNKRTMGRADVIYGVTMQEFGVSKPVGVRMTTDDESSRRKRKTRSEPDELQLEAEVAAEEGHHQAQLTSAPELPENANVEPESSSLPLDESPEAPALAS
ncbi:MAG: hypothetical protein LDL31_12250, partial [Prosthecobacter sp.]|nr:hypothetical protein [Prosthecobacter sp.]